MEEPTEKVPITAFLSIFSVTLFKNYRKRTLKILRSEVFQWPLPEQENLREHPRNGKVGCNRHGQKDAKQQVRGLRGNKTARGYGRVAAGKAEGAGAQRRRLETKR